MNGRSRGRRQSKVVVHALDRLYHTRQVVGGANGGEAAFRLATHRLPMPRLGQRIYTECVKSSCSSNTYRSNMLFSPTVLYPLTLAGLLHHILTTQSATCSTTLIICSSRETFLDDLLQSLQHDLSEKDGNMQDLATPSLHNLFTTRHVRLAFCASVQALLAYLTAFGRDGHANMPEGQKKARLVLVNPLALHAATPSFSAQGLSRAFAAATETALKTDAELQVVECQVKHRIAEDKEDEDIGMEDIDEDGNVDEEQEEHDPWEQEVSILNVSARRFGSNSGERAWAGRTIKVKNVAARWFRFQQLCDHETREGLG
jgi:hypothetical protein